jgi:hypothetical protein
MFSLCRLHLAQQTLAGRAVAAPRLARYPVTLRSSESKGRGANRSVSASVPKAASVSRKIGRSAKLST